MKSLRILILLMALSLVPQRVRALSYDAQSVTEDSPNGRALKKGSTLYWCPTDNGCEWTRIEIHGMSVISIKRFQTLFMEEAGHHSITAGRIQREEPSSHMGLPLSSRTGSLKKVQGMAQINKPLEDSLNKTQQHIFSSSDGACFHTVENCPSGRAIHNTNSLSYASEEDAKEAGLLKCRRCLFIEKIKADEL